MSAHLKELQLRLRRNSVQRSRSGHTPASRRVNIRIENCYRAYARGLDVDLLLCVAYHYQLNKQADRPPSKYDQSWQVVPLLVVNLLQLFCNT